MQASIDGDESGKPGQIVTGSPAAGIPDAGRDEDRFGRFLDRLMDVERSIRRFRRICEEAPRRPRILSGLRDPFGRVRRAHGAALIALSKSTIPSSATSCAKALTSERRFSKTLLRIGTSWIGRPRSRTACQSETGE